MSEELDSKSLIQVQVYMAVDRLDQQREAYIRQVMGDLELTETEFAARYFLEVQPDEFFESAGIMTEDEFSYKIVQKYRILPKYLRPDLFPEAVWP
jgi:hypothetical protein